MNSFFVEQLRMTPSIENFTAYNKFLNFKLNRQQSISINFYFLLFLKISKNWFKFMFN